FSLEIAEDEVRAFGNGEELPIRGEFRPFRAADVLHKFPGVAREDFHRVTPCDDGNHVLPESHRYWIAPIPVPCERGDLLTSLKINDLHTATIRHCVDFEVGRDAEKGVDAALMRWGRRSASPDDHYHDEHRNQEDAHTGDGENHLGT